MHICNIIGYNFSKIYYFNNFSTICCYLCRANIKICYIITCVSWQIAWTDFALPVNTESDLHNPGCKSVPNNRNTLWKRCLHVSARRGSGQGLAWYTSAHG